MAGHSKWANIKRRKASQDAQKNRARTRMVREIIVAVQVGGTDNNARLQIAVQNAKKANVPKSKIEEAVKRASGAHGVHYEEVLYEAYAPHGVALVVETMTDNARRTVAVVRSILTKYGGKLASQNAVAHHFERKGVFTLATLGESDTEALTLALLEAGMDDLEETSEALYVTCPLQAFHDVRGVLDEAGLTSEEATLQYVPRSTVHVSAAQGGGIAKLIEALEHEEDVQRVYDNMEIEIAT